MSEKEYYLLTDSAWVPENTEIQGEYISNGKIVTGIGTSFTTDLQGGDWLVHPILNEVSMIRTVETDTRLELYKPFSQDVSLFDPDYQAVLDYATTEGYTLPSAEQQTLQNTLVTDLKAAGVWDKLDAFSVFATDGDANFALIDWVRLINMTAVSSPTFTTNAGFVTDGASSYIDTNFSMANDGVNYQLNSASYGFYWNAPSTSGSEITGARDGSALNLSYIVDRTIHKINSDVFSVNFTSNSTIGLWHINRTNATTMQRYVNGTLQGSAADNSEGRTIADFYLGALNNNGSAITFDPNTFRVAFFGADLSAEAADFNTAIQNYLTAI